MHFTDAMVMPGPDAHRSTEELRAMRQKHEADQDKRGSAAVPAAARDGHLVGFSTSLTDDDRRYLDTCAELYARGEYTTSGGRACDEEPQSQ